MIACWWLLGGAAGPEQPGRLGWDIPERGYGAVADHFRLWVLPHLRALGIKPRLFLHNPFGLYPEKTGRQMTLHQERLAESDDRLDFAVSSFQPAFMPLVKEGVEVVAYVGLESDPPAAKPSTRWNQLHAAFNRILATGCSVAFDVVGVWSASDPAQCEPRLCRLFQSLGVTVYGEGAPILPEWSDIPIIIDATSSDAWRSTDPTTRKPNTIVRIRSFDSPQAQLTMIHDLLKRGFVPAVEPGLWKDHGLAIVEVVKAAFGA